MASEIYSTTDEAFIEAINTSRSVNQTLIKLGLNARGGAYKVFYKRVKKLGIDISHFTGCGFLKGQTHNWSKKISLEELLVSNSDKVLTKYKGRLVEAGLLKNECQKCGITDTWMGEPIVLQIDHINGDSTDHRIENLRLMCANCHSQTPTFCSKNKKKMK